MIRIKKYIYLAMALLLCWGCNPSIEEQKEPQQMVTIHGSDFETEILPFSEIDEDGAELCPTRVNLDGNQFETNDLMRLRVIAPFVTSSEYGENTWSGTYDNWRLYTWGGKFGKWGQIPESRGFDMNGDFKPSTHNGDIIMPQATPFVFTATTWTEEIHYVLQNGNVVLSFSNIFKADQREKENYKASDVLWAQQYMQTGTDHVRLSFEHKMAALKIDVREFTSLLNGTEEVILTLENMPDIDQQEVTIGNYYAEKMKSKIAYGDYYRTMCTYANNGKVLGIVVPNESVGHLEQIAFTTLPQTGVYTALKGSNSIAGTENGYFYLIIPPYTVLPDAVTPTLWLRQGEKRWSAPLTLPADRTFEMGKRYSVKMSANP